MAPRRFTPAQANRTLPLVRRVVADILQRGRELRHLTSSPLDARGQERVPLLQSELTALFDELEHVGCSYKDWGFELGLIDFPAEIGGREVLLCWRSDEEEVAFYHAPEAGFDGRRPIPTELLEPGGARTG